MYIYLTENAYGKRFELSLGQDAVSENLSNRRSFYLILLYFINELFRVVYYKNILQVVDLRHHYNTCMFVCQIELCDMLFDSQHQLVSTRTMREVFINCISMHIFY